MAVTASGLFVSTWIDILDSVSIVTGGTVSITAMTVTQPDGT